MALHAVRRHIFAIACVLVLACSVLDDKRSGTWKPSGTWEKMVRTPAKLDFCKRTWPFQDKKTHKNVQMCVKCKADAPLPLAIALNGKRLIWICNANRFTKKEGCENWLSWLGTDRSPL